MGTLAHELLVAGPVLPPGVRLYRGVRPRATVFSRVSRRRRAPGVIGGASPKRGASQRVLTSPRQSRLLTRVELSWPTRKLVTPSDGLDHPLKVPPGAMGELLPAP